MNSIVLFKNNLRINDNPALFHASKSENKILPVYIHDDINIKINENDLVDALKDEKIAGATTAGKKTMPPRRRSSI